MSLLVNSIDSNIQQKSLLKHRFYQLWSAGSLSIEDLQGYSKEYFQLVKAVPNFVNNVLEQVTPELEQNFDYLSTIKRNLEEEKQHIAPWVSFAESIGVKRNELYDYECSRMTRDAVLNMSRLTCNSLASGLSTLYTFEKQLPEISSKKIEGLVKFYDIQSDTALEYFRIHQRIDIEHADLWRHLLESMPASSHETILDAASKSLIHQNIILDGVCETYLTEKEQLPN
ncbi:MAG: TenA family transcriptional regulator [Nitrososphaeraceae archaeon]